MDIRTRKAVGCASLLAYMTIYVALAATLGAYLVPTLATWAEPIFYAAAGVIWIFPLKPLFGWMNRGG